MFCTVLTILQLLLVSMYLAARPGLILFVNHDYFYSIEIFFNQKLFCNRRFLRLKLFLFLFDYFSKLPVIVINLKNKL